MYLSPKQVQDRYGYHPKTLARWANEGRLDDRKSPGGHRRASTASFTMQVIGQKEVEADVTQEKERI